MGTANNNRSTLSSSQTTTADQAYTGVFKLEKRILSFLGCSVQLDNITQVSNYPVRPANRITLLLLIVSIFISFGSVAIIISLGRYDEELKQTLIFVFLVFITIAGIGIAERLRPYNYGITVELSSGFRHYFIHKSKDFIDQTYRGFVTAIQENKDFQAVFHNANIISVGDGSIVGNITGNTLESIGNTGESRESSNIINLGKGNITGDIKGNTQVNQSDVQQSTNSIDFGSGNVTGNISDNSQAG